MADWTENAVLLAQLRRFEDKRPLSAWGIKVASLATTLKVVFIVLSWLVTIDVAVHVALHA